MFVLIHKNYQYKNVVKMKKKTALTVEQIDQRINAGKEKLIAKKNEALAAAEKKFKKGLKALEDKFKVKSKKAKEPKAKKVKEPKENAANKAVDKKVKLDEKKKEKVNKNEILTEE